MDMQVSDIYIVYWSTNSTM